MRCVRLRGLCYWRRGRFHWGWVGPDCVDDGHFRFFPPFLFPIFSLSRFNSLDLMRPATSVFDFLMFFPFDRSLLYFIPDLGSTMLGSVIVIKVFRAFLSWRKDTGRVSAFVASRNGFLSSVVTDADIFCEDLWCLLNWACWWRSHDELVLKYPRV